MVSSSTAARRRKRRFQATVVAHAAQRARSQRELLLLFSHRPPTTTHTTRPFFAVFCEVRALRRAVRPLPSGVGGLILFRTAVWMISSTQTVVTLSLGGHSTFMVL